MTHEEFDQLVHDVEAGIGRDAPALYRRVLRLAAIGYLGLLLPLILVLLFGAAFIIPGVFSPDDAFALIGIGALVLAIGGWAASRTLWIQLPPPKGREILRAESPVLFATLDELRLRLRSAPFNHVLVVPDCNAFCAPRPRLGVFGWNQNYLILGLPLMEGLSREELTAVLAHECAHLSRRHHRSGQWVYRLRRSWQQVFESMSRAGNRGRISISPLTRKFVAWFWPRFNAHAFVLSRTHEYQADAVAAELTRPAHIATALVRIGWYGRVLEEKFWPDLWQLTRSNPAPPENVFLRVSQSLGNINHQSEAKWLEKAFRSTTTNADTHPCLTDRLRAIGWPLNPDHPDSLAALAAPQPTAAEFFFGAALPKIRADVEKLWRAEREADWRKQHAKAGMLNERLHQLDAASQTVKSGDVDVLWEKARALMDLQQRETVVPLLREIVARDPKHVAANFNLGSFLCHADDAEGETYLERAVAENDELLRRPPIPSTVIINAPARPSASKKFMPASISTKNPSPLPASSATTSAPPIISSRPTFPKPNSPPFAKPSPPNPGSSSRTLVARN